MIEGTHVKGLLAFRTSIAVGCGELDCRVLPHQDLGRENNSKFSEFSVGQGWACSLGLATPGLRGGMYRSRCGATASTRRFIA